MKTLVEWENHQYPHKGGVRVANVQQPEYVSPSEKMMAKNLIDMDLKDEVEIDFDQGYKLRDLTGMIEREQKKV